MTARQSTTRLPDPDVQARVPAVAIGLSRVGVTGVERVISLGGQGLLARLECVIDLGPDQRGAHMSRFEEVVNEVTEHAAASAPAWQVDRLAQRIAEVVRERQGTRGAEVSIVARQIEHKVAPVSGSDTQQVFTLLGRAVAGDRGVRRVLGVKAAGMTACPCAQELVAARARERLAAEDFSDEEIDRILVHVPVATHNQRGLGTLQIGCVEADGEVTDSATLLGIVRGSMSSEIYELMKRVDEVEVVEQAHRRPRFVEDCVREMIAGAVASHPLLGEDSFICARQENLETIHQHNVIAERHGRLGELRRELASGEPTPRHTTMREWLDA